MAGHTKDNLEQQAMLDMMGDEAYAKYCKKLKKFRRTMAKKKALAKKMAVKKRKYNRYKRNYMRKWRAQKIKKMKR